VILFNHRRFLAKLLQVFYVYLPGSSLNKIFLQKHYLPDVDIRLPVKLVPKVLPSKFFLYISTMWSKLILIYLLTAVGLYSVAVVQYTFTHKQYVERYKTNNKENTTILEECGPCPVLASYTLASALQPRKKHGKTSVRVTETSFFLENP
jgi:hypothetical protein